MIQSFQEIPARLKARRSLGKDQHLCQLEPLSAQGLACLAWSMTTERHRKMLPECGDPGGAGTRRVAAVQVEWTKASAPEEAPDFLGQVVLGERLRQERGASFEEPSLEDLGCKA